MYLPWYLPDFTSFYNTFGHGFCHFLTDLARGDLCELLLQFGADPFQAPGSGIADSEKPIVGVWSQHVATSGFMSFQDISSI